MRLAALGLFACLVACNPANTAATVDLGGCILKQTIADTDAGMSATATLIDVAQKCGTDVVTVVTTLDNAQKAADATKAARVK